MPGDPSVKRDLLLRTVRAVLSVAIPSGALILALILFVLARVFRRGADMRDGLEGTV